MERGRGWTRCVLWGGIALGVGTVLFALCSPSSVGCATNLVVLTHSQVTARGCAVFSVAAHLGVGLIVLGAVLLLGSFVLAVRQRRQAAEAASTAAVPSPVEEPRVAAAGPASSVAPSPAAVSVEGPPVPTPPAPTSPAPTVPPVERRRVERRAPARVGPIPPGEDEFGPAGPVPPGAYLGPAGSASLPPGWYGNPDNPGGPVQWWDGTRLVDRPR